MTDKEESQAIGKELGRIAIDTRKTQKFIEGVDALLDRQEVSDIPEDSAEETPDLLEEQTEKVGV